MFLIYFDQFDDECHIVDAAVLSLEDEDDVLLHPDYCPAIMEMPVPSIVAADPSGDALDLDDIQSLKEAQKALPKKPHRNPIHDVPIGYYTNLKKKRIK